MEASYTKSNMNQGNPPPYTAQPTYPAPPGNVYPGRPTVVQATVVPAVVPVVVGQYMGPDPSSITCKSCNMTIVTRTQRRSTLRTHLFAALLFIIGCWPCMCIPYCVDSCNNIDHYCPNCNSYVGGYIH